MAFHMRRGEFGITFLELASLRPTGGDFLSEDDVVLTEPEDLLLLSKQGSSNWPRLALARRPFPRLPHLQLSLRVRDLPAKVARLSF